jgi:PAS domain S-box-containing protein
VICIPLRLTRKQDKALNFVWAGSSPYVPYDPRDWRERELNGKQIRFFFRPAAMSDTVPPTLGDEDESATIDHPAFYREILDSAVDTAVIGTDAKGRITTWSAGAYHITGWSGAEMLGQHLSAIFTPEDRAAGRPDMEMRAADQSGRANDMRWHLRKDGRRFFAHGSISPLKAPLKGYVKSFRDATQQHQTETALKESQARYTSLFNSIDAGFCIVDIEFD